MNIGAASAITTLTATAAGNIVNYTGAGQTVKATSYATLNVTGTATNSGTVTVATDLGGAGTLTNAATRILNIGGTSTIATLTATAAGNIVNYTGAGAQTVKATTYDTLNFSGAGVKTNAGVVTVNTALTGTALTNTGTLNIGGTSAITTLTATANPNTVTYNGAAAQTVKSTTYHDLTLSNAAGTTLGGAITVNGNLGITSGTLADNGSQITGNATGTFTMASGTGLTLGVAGTATTFPTLFTAANIGLNAASTVNYAAGVAQTVATTSTAAIPYGNLTFSGANTKTTAAGTLTVAGNWTVNSTTALNTNNTVVSLFGNLLGTGAITQGTGLITAAGDWTHTGAFTASSAGVTLTGAANSITGAATGITFTTLTVDGTYTNNNASAANGILVSTALSGSGTLTQAASARLRISGTSGITTLTATAAGNIVDYTGAGAQTVKAMTYDTLGFSGAGVKTNADVVTVNTALTGTALTNSATGTLNIGGTSAITTLTATAAGNIVNYTGAGAQTVKATTYDTLNFSGAGVKTNAGVVTVNTALTGTALTNGAAGTLNIGGTDAITTLTATAAGNTVNYTSAAQTVKATTYHHLTLSGSGVKTMTGVTTIAGDLGISGTATMSGNAAFTVTGALNYSSTAGTTTLTAATAISIGRFNQTGAGGTFSDNGNTITVTGTGASTWTKSAGTFTATGTEIFTGAAPQIGASNFNDLTINVGAGNTATLTGAATPAGNLTVSTGTFALSTFLANRTAAGGTIAVSDGATLNIGGTNTFPTNYTTHTLGATSTVNYSGTSQAVTAETYGNLTLSGSGTKTPAAGTSTVAGTFTLAAGVTYAGTTNNPVVNLAGNFSTSGTFNSGTGTFTFNGAGAQTLTGTTTFTRLQMNNSTGLTINNNVTVSTLFTLESGNITTGANVLIASATCATSVSRTSGHVIGGFQKAIPAGASTCTFEIGSAGSYTPATLSFTGVTAAGGGLIARVGTPPADHPNIGTSGLGSTVSVNRWWALTTTGVTGTALPAFTNYSATFTFINPDDLDGGANTANFEIERWTGAAWNTTTVGTRTGATTQATGITALGEFAIAEKFPTFNQSAYRLFNNTDSTDVGTALAAQNTAATLGSTGAAFRLRMLLHVANANIATSGQVFKLQFAARSGTCDTAFSGETYADVTTTSVIAYNNNAAPADGANLTANANDPTHGADTVVNQNYGEANNFTNTVAAINIGQDGKWDFALVDNGAPVSTAYCFRVVKDTGAVLNTYTVIPEITTAIPTFNQSAYRLFNNADSTDVGTALAAQDSAATLGATGAAFRLRMLLHVTGGNLATSGQVFKLQFAARSGTCDTAFSGETYADVTTTSVIAYNNNAAPADGANLTANANDPTHGADTVVNQNYEEANNFTNTVAAINSGQDGKWDFALVDNGAPVSTAYCFRVVKSTGAVLETYTVIPEITSAPRGTVFYFHNATTPNIGTLPAATTLSATTPDVTAATAGTNRDMNQTFGTAQASSFLTTNASTILRENWFRRFLSRPLAAQTLPTGVWKIQGAVSESSLNSNMLAWGAVITVWRPSTGATVATLLDNPQLGTGPEPTATNTQTNVSTLTPSITGVAVNDGDILVAELWAKNTQSSATAYTNTIFYDGLTEGSTATNAAFLQAPAALTFYRSLRQSAYRLFNNADSTDVGPALAAQNTAATLGSTGAAFRLRMLLHVADINLGISGEAFKLQFAVRSGTCDTAFSGETYADVTTTSVIAYKNNATPADGATLTANANDPTHSTDTVVIQTYAESNNFTNPTAINSGQDGKWDFALFNNGATASTTYCLRAVKSDGTVLDSYSVIPEITTTATSAAVGNFNAYETSTAGGAVTGVIKTKIAGASVSVHMIALNTAKTTIATAFTGTVRVEVLDASDNSGALDADNCRSSWAVIQTLSPDPAFAAPDNGRKAISITQANSYPEARLRITFPAGAPTMTGCSNDNFAIRPNTLASFAVTDADWETAGTGRTLNDVTFGAVTHKAGRPLSVRATAQNAAAATTTNYTGSPTYTPLTACVGAACTATFGALTLTTTFVAGQLSSDVASYDNVGSFALQLLDSTFSNVDAADGSTTAERNITSSTINVGRFVPDHFAVSLNTPTFATACGAGGFTYVGHVFYYTLVPVITVTAQDFANNTTTLYAGAWARVTNSSLTPGTQAARYSRYDALGGGNTPALDLTGLPAVTGDPVIGAFSAGVSTFTFGSGTGLFFPRTTPVAAFNADITLAVDVIDADNVAYASNPAAFGAATANNGIAFNSGKPMRFGRLAMRNVNGSQLLSLRVPMETQYWNGSAFITNDADSCTTLAGSNIMLTNPQSGFTIPPAACTTSASDPIGFSNGRGNLVMAKPAGGAVGSVDFSVNLGASASGNTCVGGSSVAHSAANRPYLQGNWTGGAYNANPSARATFGVYKGADEIIFIRENF